MSRFLLILRSMLFPLLLAVYPGLVYYNNNATMILISSLGKATLINVLVMVVLYLLFFFLFPYLTKVVASSPSTEAPPQPARVPRRWRRPVYAALDTALFLGFYFSYRAAYDALLALDIVRVEHFTLLPLFILLGLYAAWFAHKLKPSVARSILQYGALIVAGLIVYNIVLIAPHEMAKLQKVQANSVEQASAAASTSNPDIYYIVLDEFASFKAMREYWKYQEVDEFKQFLLDKGFFVAEESYGSSQLTLQELSTRLNYEAYCCEFRQFYEKIANNRVMAFLKSKGYTTVAFEPLGNAFPADVPINADLVYENAPDGEISSSSQFIDEFGLLVLDQTMFYVASDFYKPILNGPAFETHRDMILFSINRATNLDDVPSPKFVYVHLFLPHVPFVFDANGDINRYQAYYDWNYYLGSYIYATKVTREMINEIMAQSDPNNPPIIILQSDHGARNDQMENGAVLENYPEAYKTSILFTLFIPGYDYSQLPQDIDPINTFPIVFNHVFDAGIPLEK